ERRGTLVVGRKTELVDAAGGGEERDRGAEHRRKGASRARKQAVDHEGPPGRFYMHRRETATVAARIRPGARVPAATRRSSCSRSRSAIDSAPAPRASAPRAPGSHGNGMERSSL